MKSRSILQGTLSSFVEVDRWDDNRILNKFKGSYIAPMEPLLYSDNEVL